ncbi:aspartate kinase [bacterium]|nr:aspartate kinase [bacterium]
MNLKVCKFGGTSMADKDAITKVKDIILSDNSRRFVVVSAPGKRYSGDEKVTDLLYACYDEKLATGNCKSNFDKIRERFVGIVRDLNLKIDIEKHLNQVEQGIIDSVSPDFSASRGEYLSALIMAEVLGFEFIDAAEIIKFNVNGCFDDEYTNDLVSKTLCISNGAVVPGFYGAMPDGKVKTFSRGGSDFTGAIIARGVMADVYENWTDVDGFMTTDPRIVKNPMLIDSLSYEELRELSYMGASVLHPEATFPLRNTDIPINIKNTFNPNAKGTFITKSAASSKSRLVTGIAGIKGFTTILIKKTMMNSEIGFCRKILSVLEYYNINLEHMPTGIDTMSLILPDSDLKNGIEFELIEKIRGKVNPDAIYVYKDISLIAIVGHGMSHQTGTAAKVFVALANADINIKMIDQGSSEINIIVGVKTCDLEKAISAIYHAFF